MAAQLRIASAANYIFVGALVELLLGENTVYFEDRFAVLIDIGYLLEPSMVLILTPVE